MQKTYRHREFLRSGREMARRGLRIVSRCAGRGVSARDLRPVDVSHKAVIVFYAQCCLVEAGSISNDEGEAQPRRGVDALHLGGDIAANQRAVTRTAAEAKGTHFGDLQIASHADIEVYNLNPLPFKGATWIEIRRDHVDAAHTRVGVIGADVRAPNRRADVAPYVGVDAHAIIA